MAELIIFWVVCMFIGGLVGMQKGQDMAGMLWPFFLGPLGIVVVLALPNKVKEEKEAAAKKLREEELSVQKAILAELKAQRAPVVRPPMPPAPPVVLPDPRPEALEEFIPESLRRVRR